MKKIGDWEVTMYKEEDGFWGNILDGKKASTFKGNTLKELIDDLHRSLVDLYQEEEGLVSLFGIMEED